MCNFKLQWNESLGIYCKFIKNNCSFIQNIQPNSHIQKKTCKNPFRILLQLWPSIGERINFVDKAGRVFTTSVEYSLLLESIKYKKVVFSLNLFQRIILF